MDKTYDDLSAISTLVQTLTPQVTESGDHIARLEKLIQELVTKEEYQELIRQPAEATTTIDSNEAAIKKLEESRLAIVMELQKQDFLGEKLQELIYQNQDIVDSVKEYLESKDHIHREEEKHVKQLCNNFVENVVQPTIDSLDTGSLEMNKNIHKAQTKLGKVFHEKQQADEMLQSREYQQQLNELVKALNEI
ncbi:uncharacterized protein SPAPADRAFT_141014 [Spathaspora passalidarum NRRL Y-27907]|uniref:Uncharacterized protein n=1 Tax=Spathaspora passalidarum (strain NRRL Y-27907 / 11-Y1) TaxID=619300 RepID=G3AQJ6_SPAPN|nr:uncharacterized protein SPAPADRAFT_141014 [Spathaspora passalidarum NRRL Y-27907]EGW31543.1 hypothetical protein SPAPADRAFT_141014 [Spathaspora passalidarum NRRL Y-27907]